MTEDIIKMIIGWGGANYSKTNIMPSDVLYNSHKTLILIRDYKTQIV